MPRPHRNKFFPLLVGAFAVLTARSYATEPAAPAANGGASAQPGHPPPGAPGSAAGKVDPSDPNVQAPTSSVNIFSGLMDPFDYDARGRRDPFAQKMADQAVSGGPVHGPLLPLQRFELNQLRVTAILWDVKRPQAMIKDPNGSIYIVTPNSKIGPHNGYVAAIREGEIVIIETQEQDGRLVSTAQVVKIAK